MLNPSAWIAITLALIVAVVLFKVVRSKQQKVDLTSRATQPMMQAAVPQLSVVEQCCLQTLQQVAGGEYNIRNKVLLADLVDSSASNRHQPDPQRVLDFVLFNKRNLKPVCVVQLHSPTEMDDRQMEQALEQAGLSLYRLARNSSYSTSDIQELLDIHLEKPVPTPDEMVATISMTAFRQCNKCHNPMALKRASGGPHKGMLFWVCKDYPECSGVELYSETT